MENGLMQPSNAALTLRLWWEKPAANDASASAKSFPGQYYDSETGLHYNYFRDYDPTTGRYVESDPVGLSAGVNTYLYVLANPIINFDLYGLDTCSYWGMNCADPNPSPDGPFGPICGPAGSTGATWIPDVSPSACNRHDNCYESCAKECAGTGCKLTCDLDLGASNPPYGIATGLFGGSTYEDLKKQNNCDPCE